MMSLDDLGVFFGTDKCSLGHDYLRHYEYAVAPFREQDITLLEIGVLGGSSLKMWKEYMPQASIVGIDIAPICRRYAEDRVAIEIGDQSDPKFLAHLRKAYVPSIVIDDGSHQAEHIIASFEGLFPALMDGGVYIIEDLQIHHPSRPEWKTDSPNLPDYCSTIARNLISRLPDGAESPFLRYAYIHIDKIIFFPKAVAIWKRPAMEAAKAKFERLTNLLENTQSGSAWIMLSSLALSAGMLPEAEHAASEAIGLSGRNPHAWSQMALVRGKMGLTEEAASAAQRAIFLAQGGPAEPVLRQQLATLISGLL